MLVTTRTLRFLAGLTWYAGGAILIVKGGMLLIEAEALEPDRGFTSLVFFIGLIIGGVKARFLFSHICRKNLARIDGLNQPKLWQFFRPGFFLFLILMIVLGAALSRQAHGNYLFQLGVALLDTSIAVALLGSSYVFWRRDRSADPLR